ncbi:Protein GEI-4 c [Aphelenchoides avenae]|nr:Protein GEI-4 c [Aphelenchus avenae]
MGSMKCDEAFEIVDGDLVEGYYETTGLDDVGQLGQGGGEGEVMYYYVDEPSVSEQILPPESENTMEIDVVDLPEEKYNIPKRKQLDPAEKARREQLKRARQAESARLKYHSLTEDERKELNRRRTLQQKRKRQREREMAELEALLRASGDITDDPGVVEDLIERRRRARWAETARARYHRMSSEERRHFNQRRRLRKAMVKNEKGEVVKDETVVTQRIKEINAKKAERARQRYHNMSLDEKRHYNKRRTEAFRRRRMEEEALLAMPIGRIDGQALDRAQQIVVRNAKRAEAARRRYHEMSADQRKAYNARRYTPKKLRRAAQGGGKSGGASNFDDALSSLEYDIMRRTQQAQKAISRNAAQQQPQIVVSQQQLSHSPHQIVISQSVQQQQQPHSSHQHQQPQIIYVQQQPQHSSQTQQVVVSQHQGGQPQQIVINQQHMQQLTGGGHGAPTIIRVVTPQGGTSEFTQVKYENGNLVLHPPPQQPVIVTYVSEQP